MINNSISKKNIYLIIRYGLLVVLIVLLVLFLAQKAESRTPFETVAAAVSKNLKTEHMEKNTDRFLKKYYDLNAEDFEEVLIYTPKTNMDAEEMLLIKLKDASQKDIVTQAISKRIRKQYTIYEGYAPEEMALLDKAVVDVQGNYILYITAENAEAVDQSFRHVL